MVTAEELAINGGLKVRSNPMPYRKQFGEAELQAVTEVFRDSWEREVDFGFQGKYENLFASEFCEFLGGGYADAVSSGTVAVYLALKALNLEAGCDVIISPATNPGSVMPVALQDVKLVVPDSAPNAFNLSPETFERALTPRTRAAVLTHLGGHAVDLDPILEICRDYNIKLVEDCSQAHGTLYRGKKVGAFGDVAAFSTMFSKTLSTGGCGGIVYTRNEELYWKIRSFADRGKPFDKPDFFFKHTQDYLFPSLNFNADELSCAIGSSVLKRLPGIISKRREIARKIDEALRQCDVVLPINLELPDTESSLFFHTVIVDVDRLSVSKKDFAAAIAAEGITLNGDYRDITCEWQWIPDYVRSYSVTPNALEFRDRTINILFNERFGDQEIIDIINAIKKVESVFANR